MTSNSEYDKIEKVLAKVSGRELKDFVRLYACMHDDFATALVEKYWKPERGNCKEFGHDHRNFEPARYDVWAEQNKMLAEIVNHSAWLLAQVEGLMGHARIVDGVIKDGIRKLIADNPSKVYIRTYLGSVL